MRTFSLQSIICQLLLMTLLVLTSCKPRETVNLSNYIATVKIEEPIKGLCDPKNVVYILPLEGNGQESAEPPYPYTTIENELNAKGMVAGASQPSEKSNTISLYINCFGELLKCEVSAQFAGYEEGIKQYFMSLKGWKPARIKGMKYDSMMMIGFELKEGKIVLPDHLKNRK